MRRTSSLSTAKLHQSGRLAKRDLGGARDDGGHYIATRFNGPGDAFNHFAQGSNFKRGAYRALEDGWAKSQADGKNVRVRITRLHLRGSKRPL